MSNRKTRKEKILSQKRFEQNKELLKLNNYLAKLEYDRQKKQKELVKLRMIKNLKIFGSLCRFISPFVIGQGITIGTCKFIGFGYPIVIDNEIKYKVSNLESRENKEATITTYYDKNIDSETDLTIYSPWEEIDDSTYKRNITEYDISTNTSFTEELFQAIITKDIEYINKFFAECDQDQKEEIVNFLDEPSSEYEIEANLTFINKEDFISVPETDLVNNIETVSILGVGLLIGCLFCNKKKLKQNIKNAIEEYESERLEINLLNTRIEDTKAKIKSLERK